MADENSLIIKIEGIFNVLDEKCMIACGKSEEVLKELEDNSVDSIVTDPPYGLSFMGKDWDKALPPIEIWKECIRILKPGGYIVAMSASRTYHRLAVQLEDLGLICHPMIGWIYGSGFPKATDLSKQFDKQAGAERKIVGPSQYANSGAISSAGTNEGYKRPSHLKHTIRNITAPSSDSAKKWEGYKYGLQSLKPALEPIAVFQKTWKTKDVKRMTDNVVKHGVGAFNIDATRVEMKNGETTHGSGANQGGTIYSGEGSGYSTTRKGVPNIKTTQGRHPANLLHDGSESVEKVFLEQGGLGKTGGNIGTRKKSNPDDFLGALHIAGEVETNKSFQEESTASGVSRFFNKLPISGLDAPFLYTAKASKSERNKGLENFPKKECGAMTGNTSKDKTHRMAGDGVTPIETPENQNFHPTVKPIKLMEWLIKLVTPEGGITVDPFMGSGTNGLAAKINNFRFIGIEKNEEYFNIAKERIENGG